MIRRLGIGCVLVAALAMPAAASAKSSAGEVKNAAKHCKALRAEMGGDAFRDQFGANANKRNAFGKCVAKQARGEHRAAKKALRECKAEYTADPVAFLEKYGSEEPANASFERPGGEGEGNAPGKPESDAPDESRPDKPHSDKPARPDAALRRAMHKCVALELRARKAERREALENAVEECKSEYVADPVAFMEKYGRDSSAETSSDELGKFLAFGKCVLTKANAAKSS